MVLTSGLSRHRFGGVVLSVALEMLETVGDTVTDMRLDFHLLN